MMFNLPLCCSTCPDKLDMGKLNKACISATMQFVVNGSKKLFACKACQSAKVGIPSFKLTKHSVEFSRDCNLTHPVELAPPSPTEKWCTLKYHTIITNSTYIVKKFSCGKASMCTMLQLDTIN